MKKFHNTLVTVAVIVVAMCSIHACDKTTAPHPDDPHLKWDPFIDTLQVRTLNYFLETTHRETGLVPDRWPTRSPSSIAAIGFALTAYPIAAERQLITRSEAAERVLTTLRFMYGLPQNDQSNHTAGYKGFFYHFLEIPSGLRAWNCELSTIDTALMLAGALFCQSYFDSNELIEQNIRAVADSLYLRIEWDWAMSDLPAISMAWWPEKGFNKDYWYGYTEAMILYVLAFASPTHPVSPSVWKTWTDTYVWAEYYGLSFLSFGPLFGHQFSHCWIDFKGIFDEYMRQKGVDYFENSRRATYSHRHYAFDNPDEYRDYSENIWGITACDGPKDTTLIIDGKRRGFRTYSARGVSFDWSYDDGTIAPTAVGGSLPFAPEICIPALKTMRAKYDTLLWTQYGFLDAFNPTFRTEKTSPLGWFDHDYIGIDQGPIAIMAENLRTGMVWEIMKKNPYIQKGLHLAGFSGGWLD